MLCNILDKRGERGSGGEREEIEGRGGGGDGGQRKGRDREIELSVNLSCEGRNLKKKGGEGKTR